ncbi:MAG: PIN domain-containing protein [Chloroflexota bacterium]
MTPIFIDTAYIVALVNRRDKYHAAAKILARRVAGRLFVTTDGILLEVGNALAQHFRQEAVAIIEQFINSTEVEIVHLTPELFSAAFNRYKKYADKGWGLVDCISFEVMQERGIQESLTTDRHFVQAGFIALMAAN